MITSSLFNKNLFAATLLFFIIISAQPIIAQKNKKSKKDKTETSIKKKDDKKSIIDIAKKSVLYEGLFAIYQDSITGDIKMVIKEDQIGKEYIYFSQIADGIVEVGAFRGSYRNAKVFKIEKYFDKIEFIFQNTSSYFDPENAVSKSADANMSSGVLASLKIENAVSDKGLYLIDANKLFLNETFSQVKPAKHPKQSPYAFGLGNLNKDKTKINRIRNYPANTDLAIEYVYSKSNTLNNGTRSVADGRNVSIKVYHSLIEMPNNDYEPLIDDPRVGFFTTQVTDMTTITSANYRDLVHRWNLKKKDTNASISEPVEPIVWWMENTTPKEIRPIIKKAGEQWNLAFEEAGFKNAIVIKQQPDDADWDAGDIRYNVLRWTSSPRPPFGGYGPSFVNPRTGEILGADIMFEYKSLTNQIRVEKLLGDNSMENDELPIDLAHCNRTLCYAGDMAQMDNVFATFALKTLGTEQIEKSVIIEQFLYYLVLHEMGHTLGFNHNMKSSQLHPLADIHNAEITSKVGLIGSVMDYPSINFALDNTKQGQYWTTRPGPYDMWAIKFAYQTGRTEKETTDLMAQSTQHKLLFGNDADDMRSPGKAMDPRVNVGDLTSDAIAYSTERFKLTQLVGSSLLKNLKEEGKSYHDHRISYYSLLREQAKAATTISRYIGGVYVDRALMGQEGATKPFIPVPLEKQKEAMKALDEYVFSPDAFTFPNDIYNYLQLQRRGFDFFGAGEDPKIHETVLANQKSILNHLLHKNTLQRIVNSELYGNSYKLADFMSDLNNSIFKSDISGSVNSFRQNLQIEYTKMLIEMVTNPKSKMHIHNVRSNAIYNLKLINKMANNSAGDISTKAHKSHLLLLIENALKEVK
mgnify:CR=1 FL=1